MIKSKCIREFCSAFLQASSLRYLNSALSEISPNKLSHDSITCWLNNKSFHPKELQQIVKKDILTKREVSILVVDDLVLFKLFSKKIELINYQYPEIKHNIIAGIGLVNLPWHGLNSS